MMRFFKVNFYVLIIFFLSSCISIKTQEKELFKNLEMAFSLYATTRDYEGSVIIFKNIMQKTKNEYGTNHLVYISGACFLAKLHMVHGRLDLAEKSLKAILPIAKITFEKENSSFMIDIIGNLSNLYVAQGRYKLAEKTRKEAIALSKNLQGENHLKTILSKVNLATIYMQNKQYNSAITLYEKSRKALSNLKGYSYEKTLIIANLGYLHLLQNKHNLAEPLLKKSIENMRNNKEFNSSLFLVAATVNLADLYIRKSNYLEAEYLLKSSLNQYSKVLGKFSIHTSMVLGRLATLYQLTNQWSKATEFRKKELKISNAILNMNIWGLGDKSRQAYIQQYENERKNTHLSFYIIYKDFKNISNNAFYFSLSRKGLLLRVSSEISALAKKSDNPIIQKQVEKFNSLKSQLSALAYSGKAEKKQIEALEEKINDAEMLLSQKVSDFKRSKTEVLPDKVLENLKSNQTLIDFLVYTEIDLKTQKYKTEQVIALVANKEHGIKLIKLGEMQPITEAIQNYRRNIQLNSDKQRQQALQENAKLLYKKIWQPLQSYIGDKTNIYLIPDGILHLLPFKALIDNNGKYLAETHQITLLSSARDIVLPPLEAEQTTSSVFAAPAYDGINNQTPIETPKTITTRSTGVDKNTLYFAPLNGAKKEGELIKNIIQDAKLYTNTEASEPEINKLKSPRYLHLATHGFFIQPHETKTEKPQLAGFIDPNQSKLNKFIDNPLTRSGLALTGANLGVKGVKQADGSDGILTALEVLALDLEGTELVTLSACETGVGDIQTGEGVYSLNRAFQEAGAKAVLSSLWKVDDKATMLFMQAFYSKLLEGDKPQQALQQTQTEFMSKQWKYKDPYYWGAFTVTGIE